MLLLSQSPKLCKTILKEAIQACSQVGLGLDGTWLTLFFGGGEVTASLCIFNLYFRHFKHSIKYY